MSVDFDAIAQRGRCDVSSLRLALPLLEQGFSPPFLARYRQDELGGVSERSLWELLSALQIDQDTQQRRDALVESWQKTTLRDPAIGSALKSSRSLRMLNRLGRRLKRETGDAVAPSTKLAVRVMNPQQGDSDDLASLAAGLEGVDNPEEANSGLDTVLAERLAGDPRMIAAAVRWLNKNAKIHIAKVHDPHLSGEDDSAASKDRKKSRTAAKADKELANSTEEHSSSTENNSSADGENKASAQPSADPGSPEVEVADSADSSVAPNTSATNEAVNAEVSQSELSAQDASEDSNTSASDEVAASEGEPSKAVEGDGDSAEATASGDTAAAPPSADPAESSPSSSVESAVAGEEAGSSDKKSEAGSAKPANEKKTKKISPRQRRRRWLVSVLKPLAGKRFAGDKLSAFQVVMLGRALRSQVVVCSFEYDATRLVAELQRVAGSMNRHFESKLQETVLQFEGVIREAGETAWWDDLHEKASAKLTSTTADHLGQQVNRGALEGRVVLAIDAVGPRTAATSIVCADGRILHNEDLPCQLSTALRTQAVTRLGELIHSYHVDLIVISNGPARRATMVALGDLIEQSPEGSIRWTLADRNGADVYAGSGIANEEMRSTPRRFRAAAWLAFSVLQPAQAFAKIDPLKLRLSSFQRELADEQLSRTLNNVIVSGASRGGVDVNSAPVSWLTRIPGVTESVAEAIDKARREKLFVSRESLSELSQWGSVAGSRQALPFLRVFESEKTLDGTLIHPDDYALAEKLATSLEIELPPASPPGYIRPDFTQSEDPTTKSQISEAPAEEQAAPVEEFSSLDKEATDFAVDEPDSASDASTSAVAVDDASEAPVDSGDADPSESDESSQATADSEQDAGDTSADSTEANAEEDQDLSTVSEETPSEESADSQVTAESNAIESTESDSESSSTKVAELDKGSIPEPIRRPLPEAGKIDKCVKEWQVGSRRSHQLVQWLCDPFGDSDSSGNAPAVLSRIPSNQGLKPGDKVIGVVVGVMPFGVFIELAPDCSGLVHVSRISDSYVEDLHEAVQVGDVITAWVTGIDEKRRRVALSAVSPEREAEVQAARQASRGKGSRGNRGSGSGKSRRGARGNQDNRGGGDRGAGGGQSGPSRGDSKRGGSGAGAGRGGSQRRDGSGRGRPQRGNAARNGRGSRGRDRKPESYGFVSKAEAKPISDAMQKGEEPLRSFGDLMQFFDHSNAPESPAKEPKAAAKDVEQPKAEIPADTHQDPAVDSGAGKPAADLADSVASESKTPETETPTGTDESGSTESDSSKDES